MDVAAQQLCAPLIGAKERAIMEEVDVTVLPRLATLAFQLNYFFYACHIYYII